MRHISLPLESIDSSSREKTLCTMSGIEDKRGGSREEDGGENELAQDVALLRSPELRAAAPHNSMHALPPRLRIPRYDLLDLVIERSGEPQEP